jgi:hypothetical protein
MPADTSLIVGPHNIVATDRVEVSSRNAAVMIRSGSTETGEGVHIDSKDSTTLTAGEVVVALTKGGNKLTMTVGLNGTMLQCAGPPIIGPRIELKPDSIELAVGPPGVGTSISLNATGITLQCGLTSLKLSLTGIEESVGITQRKAEIAGHKLTAAASSVEVAPVGVTLQGPIVKETADGLMQIKSTIQQSSFDAMGKDQAGITMLG